MLAAVAARPFLGRLLLTAAATGRMARPLASIAADAPDHLISLHEELASGEAQLLDVREPNEAAAGMLASAQLVPLSALQQGVKPEQDT